MRFPALLAAALVIGGCGSKPAQKATKETPAAPEYFRVDPATAGRVRGIIRFAGQKPAPRVISMNAEEACEKLHPSGVREEAVVVGSRGALANALVYIKSGLEGKKFEPPAEAVVLDQRGCMFVPRVVAIQAGQTLSVRNSDPVSHNIHPRPEQNREWNQQQPPGAPDLKRRFTVPEIAIPVKCNIHSWMRAFIAVTDHPYVAVTNAKGEFAWPAVPPGEYVVVAWHDTLGEVTQKVSVAPGAEVETGLEFRR